MSYKEKIDQEEFLTVEEERQLIDAKDLEYLKKYLEYSVLFPQNEVHFVYNFKDTEIFGTYLQTDGLCSSHAQAACAKLCSKEDVMCIIKDLGSRSEEVEKELVSRGDEELLEFYEKEFGDIDVDDV
jgi:hypothetical protein